MRTDNHSDTDNNIEQFMTLFNKMFSETKYNLQALNKRIESMDKCFNNIMLLKTDKPFDEDEEQTKSSEEKNNLKITSKELDEIEKMFNKDKLLKENNLLNKKRNKKVESYSKNAIDELLKTYSKNDNKISNNKNKKTKNNNKDYSSDEEGEIIIDCSPDRKIEKYTKFKEMKRKIQKIGNNSSDDEEIDDDLDFEV